MPEAATEALLPSGALTWQGWSGGMQDGSRLATRSRACVRCRAWARCPSLLQVLGDEHVHSPCLTYDLPRDVFKLTVGARAPSAADASTVRAAPCCLHRQAPANRPRAAAGRLYKHPVLHTCLAVGSSQSVLRSDAHSAAVGRPAGAVRCNAPRAFARTGARGGGGPDLTSLSRARTGTRFCAAAVPTCVTHVSTMEGC